MTPVRYLAALVVASVLAIVACSGGGTSGGPSVTQTLPSTPTPTPIATDTDRGGVPDVCELRQRPQMDIRDPSDDRAMLGKADGFFSCPEMQLPTPTPTATPTCHDAQCVQPDGRRCVDGSSLVGEMPLGQCRLGHCVYPSGQTQCDQGCAVGSDHCAEPTPTPTAECPPPNAFPAEGTHYQCTDTGPCRVVWGWWHGSCEVGCTYYNSGTADGSSSSSDIVGDILSGGCIPVE